MFLFVFDSIQLESYFTFSQTLARTGLPNNLHNWPSRHATPQSCLLVITAQLPPWSCFFRRWPFHRSFRPQSCLSQQSHSSKNTKKTATKQTRRINFLSESWCYNSRRLWQCQRHKCVHVDWFETETNFHCG